jgi:hypothetical protein
MPTAVYILRRRFNYDGRHPRLPTGYGGVQGQVSLSRTDSHPRAPHQLNKGRAPHPARPALALADPARAGRSTQPEWTHRALPEQSRASTHPRSGAAAAVSRASARCPADNAPARLWTFARADDSLPLKKAGIAPKQHGHGAASVLQDPWPDLAGTFQRSSAEVSHESCWTAPTNPPAPCGLVDFPTVIGLSIVRSSPALWPSRLTDSPREHKCIYLAFCFVQGVCW